MKAPIKLENGATYFGEWVNDLRHGKGILLCDDGSKYEGYFY